MNTVKIDYLNNLSVLCSIICNAGASITGEQSNLFKFVVCTPSGIKLVKSFSSSIESKTMMYFGTKGWSKILFCLREESFEISDNLSENQTLFLNKTPAKDRGIFRLVRLQQLSHSYFGRGNRI